MDMVLAWAKGPDTYRLNEKHLLDMNCHLTLKGIIDQEQLLLEVASQHKRFPAQTYNIKKRLAIPIKDFLYGQEYSGELEVRVESIREREVSLYAKVMQKEKSPESYYADVCER